MFNDLRFKHLRQLAEDMQVTISNLTVNSDVMNNNFEFKDLLKITDFFSNFLSSQKIRNKMNEKTQQSIYNFSLHERENKYMYTSLSLH